MAFVISIGSVSLPGTISFVVSIGPIALAMGVPVEPLALLVAATAALTATTAHNSSVSPLPCTRV